jgi:hypothetical protein
MAKEPTGGKTVRLATYGAKLDLDDYIGWTD